MPCCFVCGVFVSLSPTPHWNCAWSFVKVPFIYLSTHTCTKGRHDQNPPPREPALPPTSLANTIPSGLLIKGNYSEIIPCSDSERWANIFASLFLFEVKCMSTCPDLNRFYTLKLCSRYKKKVILWLHSDPQTLNQPQKCGLYQYWAKTEITDYITSQPPVCDFQRKMTN